MDLCSISVLRIYFVVSFLFLLFLFPPRITTIEEKETSYSSSLRFVIGQPRSLHPVRATIDLPNCLYACQRVVDI